MVLLQKRRLKADVRCLHPLDPDDLHELGAELVVPLAARLVGGLVGVREEDPAAALAAGWALDLVELPELHAVVAEVHLEYPPVALAEQLLELSDLPQHGGGALPGDQEAELEAELRVGDGEDRLLVARLALDGVVLPDVLPRVPLDELPVVAEGAAEHPLDVDHPPLLRVVVLVLVAHVPRQFVRPGAEAAAVEVPSDGPLAAHPLEGLAAGVDVADGLAVPDPRGDDGVHLLEVGLAYPLEGPRLPSAPLGGFLGLGAVIVPLPVGAEPRLRAPVADVGELPPARAFAGDEVLALAEDEFRGPLGGVAASLAVGAGVPAVLVGAVVDDLAEDRGPGFPQDLRDFCEREALGHPRLQVDAIVAL